MNSVPILSIQGLRVEYPTADGALISVVEDVSINIASGEVHALVGESGAGKSTVGNAVMGLIDPPGRVSGGTILIDGRRLDDRQGRGAIVPGRDIGAIFQDPMTSLNPLFTVGSQLVETIAHHLPVSTKAARALALELLRVVDIPEPERRYAFYPHQLSGGQRQRVVIAAALCCNPKLLVADEPTTALDVSIQAQILQLIRRLADERGLGVLLVTHNMAAVAQIADSVTIMHAGRVIETGEVGRVLTAPQHAYARDLIASVPRLDLKSAQLAVSGKEAHNSRQAKEFLCTKVVQKEHKSAALLEIQNVTVDYITRSILRGTRTYRAVADVSLSLQRGEIFGIVGESGSGKTTLANTIAGLIRPTTGDIRFEGNSIVTNPNATTRRAIQMIFQDPYSSLNPRMRIGRAIAEPIEFYRVMNSRAEARQKAGLLLKTVELNGDDISRRFPHAFSGGQRQRISIARALAAQPSLLICDEPTSALDVTVQSKIINLLKDLRDAADVTMLFISHDLAVVRQMCDRVAVMKAGCIVEMSSCESLFDAPQHAYTKHLLSCVPSMTSPKSSGRGFKRYAG